MNERTAGKAFEFKPYEARSRLRELVRKGLLREVQCPRERQVETTLDGPPRDVDGPLPRSFRRSVLFTRRRSGAPAREGSGGAQIQFLRAALERKTVTR